MRRRGSVPSVVSGKDLHAHRIRQKNWGKPSTPKQQLDGYDPWPTNDGDEMRKRQSNVTRRACRSNDSAVLPSNSHSVPEFRSRLRTGALKGTGFNLPGKKDAGVEATRQIPSAFHIRIGSFALGSAHELGYNWETSWCRPI